MLEIYPLDNTTPAGYMGNIGVVDFLQFTVLDVCLLPAIHLPNV